MRMSTKGRENYDEYQGNRPPGPGRYHMSVADIDASFDKFDALIVTFAVVTGDNKEMEGRQLREMFFLTDKGDATDSICRLAMVLGLIGGGQEADVDWEQAKGRSLIVGVGTRKSKKKESEEQKTFACVVDYGLATWAIGHPDVADVPVDKAFIADGGDEPAVSSGSESDKSDDEWNM